MKHHLKFVWDVCLAIGFVLLLFCPVFAEGSQDKVESLLGMIRSAISLTASAVGVVITVNSIFNWYIAFRAENGEQMVQAGQKMVVGIIIIVMPQIIAAIINSISLSKHTVTFAFLIDSFVLTMQERGGIGWGV